jgi:beta-galactosidase
MKFKPCVLFCLLLTSGISFSQNIDSVRRVVQAMNFDLPVLSPIPASVHNVKVASISLNGIWKFNPENKDIKNARDIEVPGEWEMQGFKVAKGNFATYWKTFSLPSDWQGNTVKIRFDGISSYGLIKINGKMIGSHEGSFAAFEFDITDALRSGDNLLEVEVQCETISDILACTSQYAAHPVGGILRKVTLFVLPSINISDCFWNVKFDSQYLNASLNITSKIVFNSSGKKAKLKYSMQDLKGESVNLDINTFDVVANKSTAEVNSMLQVKSPKQWDPEHPNLYLLTTSLEVDGKVLQVNTQKIGFRQIELRGNQFFVNNHAIKLKGVDRHEVHPLRGRSLTPELCRRDVELFRAGNCNYLRTSHYPPSEEFLQACDELGMFVESEASLCWIEHHASPIWQTWKYLDNQYLPYMVRANFDNVLLGRGHPCIIIWSLGNESRWSPLWERVNAEVKKLDPSRPTAFHDQCWGAFNNAKSMADIANYHYPGFNGPRECEKEKTRPTLFGEYMHVQCYARREIETDPSVRSDSWAVTLKQMVDSVYSYPACMGGAIWSGVDDIFHLSEDKICGYGPWGPIDGWRREKPEYTGMKKSYSPVIIRNLRTVKAINGQIKLDIENRYNFANLNELKIVVRAGTQILNVNANIPPLSRGSASIDLSGANLPETMLITFTDPRGFVCQEEVIQISPPKPEVLSLVEEPAVLTEENSTCNIKSGKTTFIINKTSGELECVISGGQKLITAGGKLMLIHFNSDDGGAPKIAGNNYTQDIQPLEYMPVEKFGITSVVPTQLADGTVQVVISGFVENELEGVQKYIFNRTGNVEVSYDFTALTDFAKSNLLRQFGLMFTLPGTFDQLTWKRIGLWTTYPEYDINRLQGSAKALPRDLKYVEAPREIPSGEWKDNSNRLGSNDFKSTKDHFLRISLKNEKNIEIEAQSDGSQSARAWVDGENIRFLVAGMNGPGSCPFFTGPRPEYKKGEHLKGSFILKIK